MKSNLNILDIGCGVGNSTKVIRETFPHAEIFGLDFSIQMLEAAKEFCLGVNFICGDGEELETYFQA